MNKHKILLIFTFLSAHNQRDEGKRGIADLIIPGELEAGAIDLHKAKKVSVLHFCNSLSFHMMDGTVTF